jgi:hypothetical protein
MRVALSLLAPRTNSSFGEKATQSTDAAAPESVARGCPVRASHTFTVYENYQYHIHYNRWRDS